MRRTSSLVATVAVLLAPDVALAHSRFFCPAARDPSTGLKTGPCGVAGDDGSDYYAATDAIEIAPGPMTIVWQESIAHAGAPWRFSLSGDGNDLEECILLDHVPHSPTSSPTFSNEGSWTLYNLTIVIPDVACEKCSLHLTNPMTDKIGSAAYANGAGCCDPGDSGCTSTSNPAQCSSVYHSCTVPLKITGSTPRSSFVCPSLPTDWPTTWTGTSSGGSASVDVSTPNVYRQESSTWQNGQLQTAPSKYRMQAGVCTNGVAENTEQLNYVRTSRRMHTLLVLAIFL